MCPAGQGPHPHCRCLGAGDSRLGVWGTARGALGRERGVLAQPQAWLPLQEDTCSDCEQVVTLLTHMLQESPVKVPRAGLGGCGEVPMPHSPDTSPHPGSLQQALGQKCQELPIPTMVPMCQELVDKAFALLLTCLEGQVVSAECSPPLLSSSTPLPRTGREGGAAPWSWGN